MTEPVLIVGAGPTGLTAALELTRFRVPVRLIDERAAPATTSRAIGVQARTLELFHQRGIADALVSVGNPARYGSIYGGGKRVFHLDFAHVESPFPYLLFASQAETERLLRESLARLGVAPEWNTELAAFRQDKLATDAAPVHAVLRHAQGERLETFGASWLISAEGAHSSVRATLDLAFEGHTRDEQYALADMHVDGALADTDFHIFSSEHGFMALFPMGGDHFRLIASDPPGAPAKEKEPTLAEIQAIYDARSHIPARAHDLIWSSWFRINSRMVERLRVGRLLLGGDAAHIHSPAGAQGMNTGIQDMINLCWKLAAVERDGAPETLLDSYETDRLPVMRGVLARTDRLTDVIGSESAAVRAIFNHVGPYLGGAALMQRNQTAGMSQVALDYRSSPISEYHHGGGALHAGDRVPPLWVRSMPDQNTMLLDLLDPSGFTLLVVGGGVERFADLPRPVRLLKIEPPSGQDAVRRFDEVFGRDTVVLVRPDGYAALTSTMADAPSHLAAWQQTWLMGGS